VNRIKDAVDLAVGVALLVALLLVVTDAPLWLVLLGPLALALNAFRFLTDNDDNDDGDDS
jgi:hypothetical protein